MRDLHRRLAALEAGASTASERRARMEADAEQVTARLLALYPQCDHLRSAGHA